MVKRGKRSTRSRKPRKIVLPAHVRKRFEQRWRELAGAKFRPGGRVPSAVVSSLSTLASAPARQAGLAAAEVFVFVRKQEGSDCEQRAEIAGWYSHQHNGAGCIGQAAVLGILNDAASQLCSGTLHCPGSCPCSYVPRQQLASYSCTNTLEEGYLMQETEEWNCFCFAQ